MQNEIEGPHGSGIYGHNYYGVDRESVIFALEIENAHIANMAKYISVIAEDGLITDTIRDTVGDKLAEIHTLLCTELKEVLKRGDEINMKNQ